MILKHNIKMKAEKLLLSRRAHIVIYLKESKLLKCSTILGIQKITGGKKTLPNTQTVCNINGKEHTRKTNSAKLLLHRPFYS